MRDVWLLFAGALLGAGLFAALMMRLAHHWEPRLTKANTFVIKDAALNLTIAVNFLDELCIDSDSDPQRFYDLRDVIRDELPSMREALADLRRLAGMSDG